MIHENVVQMFERSAVKFADRCAISHLDRSISYRDLESRANQLASYLKTSGAPKGALVAILCADPVTAITSILGILKAGCAFVPLDTTTPEKRLAPMVETTKPEWFIVEPAFVQLALNLTSTYESELNLICTEETQLTEAVERKVRLLKGLTGHADDRPAAVEFGPDDLCYIYFTSGTTGAPKAIAGRLKGIDHFIRWEIQTLTVNEQTRVSQLLALSFDGSLRDIFVPLCAGGTICVPGDKEVLIDVPRLIKWIDSEQIDIIHCVPSLFRAICNEDLRPELFSSLQYVLMAGEALLPSDVKRWMDVFGQRVQLVNLYGTSETTMAKLIYFVRPTDAERRFISIGRPMDGTAVLLLDAKGRPCPQGTIGEIYIRTPYRSLGYYNQPELNAKSFIRNPFSDDPHDIIYKTGDLGRTREDSNYEYLGRQDQQVKIRGVRVELEEIEDLLRQHESVQDVAVIDRQDGSNFTYLCAYVVFSNGTDPAELRDFAMARLQDYMVPSGFIVMDELPRTISGKVDRRALPDVTSEQREGKLEPPQTPLEELLCGIWAEVLGLAEMGRRENFFELGGHSLSATRVVSRVRAVTGQAVALRELFEAPTVAQLAARLERVQSGAGVDGPALQRRADGSAPAPLSSAQQRLWFIDQLEPGSAAYNIPAAVRLRGPLNREALQGAFTELVRRQEALRTIFPLVDGEPVQVVQAASDWALRQVDLSGRPEAEREQELAELAAREAERGFDLAHGPLVRSRLVQLGEQEHVLLLVMHHIISDGWSMGLLVQELSTHYEQVTGSGGNKLPELELQYADYAVWQRSWLETDKLQQQLQYWQETLAGAPPLLELPLDRPRGAVLSYRGGAVSVALGEELSRELKEVARREGATLFMVLLAAFKTLLFRYTGQTDLVVGTAEAGRVRQKLEPIIGLFVNTLALRTQLSGEQSFGELLRMVRETALNAYAHQELPFDTLVEHLQPDRSLSHHPLFQVMFVLQNTPSYAISVPGLTFSAEPFSKSAAQFDLVISVTEANREFAVAAQYSTDLFDEATIKDLLQHLRTLLASVVTNPESRLADLPLITDDEHQFLTKQLNNTHSPYPEEATIQELFEKQVKLNGDSVALLDEGGRQFSYGELNRRSNQLAHHLMSLGVRPESLVGVVIDRSLESTISLLAIVKAGGAYVPLDAAYPKDRLAYMLRDSGAGIVMTKSRFVESLPEHAAHVIRIDDDWIEISQQSTENPPLRAQPEHPAYVIYTSGSTGQPKGVLGLHRGAVNRFHWMWTTYPFGDSEVCCQKTSLSFVDAVWEVFGPLLQGVPTVIFSDDVVKDTDRFVDALAHHGVTRIVLVPSLLRVMLDAREIGGRLANLKYCVCSGEALPAGLAQLFQQRLPHCTLLNLYGSSEVSADATYHEVAKDQIGRNVAIGRPLSNVQVYILDEQLKPLPVGAKGDLYVGGDALARGYLRRPDLTAERFIPDGFGERAGARLYRTGDVARRLADGTIEYLGRSDHQVKVRGYRIEPEEIESVLKQHEAVREAVVHAHEDAATGLRLTAYIVAEQPDGRTINLLREHMRERLPEYMMPAAFVLMDALPLTPNGKVDRHALPVPQKTADIENSFQPPRNATEREIVELWSELLGVERVGIEDNFFELGGHSLLATQMISRIRMNFGVELDVKKFFLRPTITTLAEVVEQNLFAAEDQAKLAGMLEAIDDLGEEEAQKLALGN